MGAPNSNKNVIFLNWYLKVVLEPIPCAMFWSHKGFWRAETNFMAHDRVQLNSPGQYKLYRMFEGDTSKLPTIVIAANLKNPLMYTACLAQAFYDFHFIVLRFASSFYVLSQAKLSVVVSFHIPCLFAIRFYSYKQWLYLFGSSEPWLARPLCIYGFGDDVFYTYSCCMSVQSFGCLFMSGPMHSALAVIHYFGNSAFFSI